MKENRKFELIIGVLKDIFATNMGKQKLQIIIPTETKFYVVIDDMQIVMFELDMTGNIYTKNFYGKTKKVCSFSIDNNVKALLKIIVIINRKLKQFITEEQARAVLDDNIKSTYENMVLALPFGDFVPNVPTRIEDIAVLFQNAIKPKNDENNNEFAAELYISELAKKKLYTHVNINTKKECGGLLIGNVARDLITGIWMGRIDDIYFEEDIGTETSFTFKPSLCAAALNYCKSNYQTGWDLSKHLIGNYHSHGNFDAFFSVQDHEMMRAYKSNEFYIVISPSHKRWAATFIDEEYKLHNVKLWYCENAAIPNTVKFNNKI